MVIRVTRADLRILGSVFVELISGLWPQTLPGDLAARLPDAELLRNRVWHWRTHGQGVETEVDVTPAELDLLVESVRTVVTLLDTEFQTRTGYEPEEALETLARLEAQRGGAGSA